MAKQDLSLDEILDKYEKSETHSKASDAKLDEILSAPVKSAQEPAPVQPAEPQAAPKKNPAPEKPYKTDQYGNPIRKRSKSSNLRRKKAADAVKPADIKRPEVSFMNSVAAIEAVEHAKNSAPSHEKQYESDSDTRAEEYQPNIRKMSDSTRAKELRAKRRGRRNQPEFTYERETPGASPAPRRSKGVEDDGAAQKPKTRFIIEDLTDNGKAAIPKPFLETEYEPEEEIEFIQVAKQTSIDLSAPSMETAEDIDIKVHTERKPLPGKPKRVRDLEKPEDIQTIRREMHELRGTIMIRILTIALMTALSCYLALGETYGLPYPEFLAVADYPKAHMTVQLIFGLVAAISSFSVIINGIRQFFQLRADCDSMASLAACSAIVATFFSLFAPEMVTDGILHTYIPVALLSLLGNAIGKLLIVTRASRNFRLLSGNFDRHAIVCVENEKRAEDLTRGVLGDFPILATMRRTNTLNDFLRYTFSSDIADKFCRIAAPAAVAFGLIVSISLTLLRAESLDNQLAFGASVFAICFAACACIPVNLITNLPLAVGSKKFVRNKAVMLGYQSVDDCYDVNSIMVDAKTLFPDGTINLSAIKIFSDTKIDDAILDAASLCQHANSILQGLFRDTIVGQDKMLRTVENFAYEESMGLCGWINNKRVLFGNRDMMTSHNIEGIPTRSKEKELTVGGKEAVYLSVSGNLAAMFVVDMQASPAIRYWLDELERKGICLILKSNDALLSLSRIAELFDITADGIKLLPLRLHPDFDAETAPLKRTSAALACSGRFSGMVQLLLGAKSIRASATLGVILQTAACVLGVLIALAYLIMQAYAELTPAMFLVYQMIWTGVIVLSVNWRRI